MKWVRLDEAEDLISQKLSMHLKISSCLLPGKMHVEEIQRRNTNVALKVLRCVGKVGGNDPAGSEKLV